MTVFQSPKMTVMPVIAFNIHSAFPSSHLLHPFFPKPLLVEGRGHGKDSKWALPFFSRRQQIFPPGKGQSQARLAVCISPRAMSPARAGIQCQLFWEQPAMEKETKLCKIRQAGMDPSFTHKISMSPWSEQVKQDQSPQIFTWYQPSQKKDISKYHPIAPPQGMYPNHFNRFLSNLFSKLLSHRFSQQSVFHFTTSLKVLMFILLPSFNPCLMPSCLSQESWRKTTVMPFKSTFPISDDSSPSVFLG